MALVRYGSTNFQLDELQRQFATLDRELIVIRKRYSDLKKEHGKKCSNALKDAVSSLLLVITYVDKSDKSLIYWYEKGSGMKRALRCVGIDKRTAAMVEKKNTKITGKAAEVESQFNRSGQVFSDGLKAVQNLNTTITEYSLNSIGDARQQAVTMYDEVDMNSQSVEVELKKSKINYEKVQEEIDGVPEEISGVEFSRRIAQQSSSSSSDAAVGSFALASVAAVASIFCPPVAVVAMSAAGVGLGSAISSRCSTSSPSGGNFYERILTSLGSIYDTQVQQLQARETELLSRTVLLQSQIQSLELEIPELDKKRTTYTKIKDDVNRLQDQGEKLQRDSQAILDELLEANMMLTRMKAKVTSIASELTDCGYARMRREIPGKLREIVQGFQIGRSNGRIAYNANAVSSVVSKLVSVEGRTRQVLGIMEA